VAKLADAPDLGSGGAILRGSSPLPGTSTAQANFTRSGLQFTKPELSRTRLKMRYLRIAANLNRQNLPIVSKSSIGRVQFTENATGI
jgi:hypothetical protein